MKGTAPGKRRGRRARRDARRVTHRGRRTCVGGCVGTNAEKKCQNECGKMRRDEMPGVRPGAESGLIFLPWRLRSRAARLTRPPAPCSIAVRVQARRGGLPKTPQTLDSPHARARPRPMRRWRRRGCAVRPRLRGKLRRASPLALRLPYRPAPACLASDTHPHATPHPAQHTPQTHKVPYQSVRRVSPASRRRRAWRREAAPRPHAATATCRHGKHAAAATCRHGKHAAAATCRH